MKQIIEDNDNGFMVELPHYSKPFSVNGREVYADNIFDAASKAVRKDQIAARVGRDWAAFVRQGANLVQVGPTFTVKQLR